MVQIYHAYKESKILGFQLLVQVFLLKYNIVSPVIENAEVINAIHK